MADRRGDRTVIDAIIDKFEEPPSHAAVSNEIFRARALEQLDVAQDIDERLVLVSRRSWLAIAAIAMLVGVGTIWAAFTPALTTVHGVGRVDTPTEAVLLVTEADALAIAPGMPVQIAGVEGAVLRIGEVMWAGDAQEQYMTPLQAEATIVPVVVSLPLELPVFTSVAGTVILEESTVLGRLLDFA